MNNELRVRKSPHGSIAVYEMRSPMSVGWRVVRAGSGDAPRLDVGYWVTDQEAALWSVATWGPDPARVDEELPPEFVCTRCSKREINHRPCCSSHGKDLCCECYRRTHFVEVGACCPAWPTAMLSTDGVVTLRPAPAEPAVCEVHGCIGAPDHLGEHDMRGPL